MTRTRSAALLMVACAPLIFDISPVMAQPTSAVQQFNIPPGALRDVLRIYGHLTSTQLIYRSDDLRAVRSGGAKGSMTADAALQALLDHTGFEARKDSSGALAIVRRHSTQELNSQPVVVNTATMRLVRQPELSPSATQDDTGSDPTVAGDIVVLARRRSENLSTTPISITAFQREDLINRSITGIGDIQSFVPGIQIATVGNRNTPTISLRGQRRNPIGEGAPAILIYKDEVPLPQYGSAIPTYDIASLQVLKGPQGTLFGRNATAGAILVFTQQPIYEVEGYGVARVTNYNGWDAEGAFNLPIVQDRIALRVAAQYLRRDGYTKNLGAGPDLDARDDVSVRASLLIQPIDTLKNTTTLEYSRSNLAANSAVPFSLYPNATAGGGGARTPAARSFFDCGQLACDVDLQLERQQQIGPRKVYVDTPVYTKFTVKSITNSTLLDISEAVNLKNIFSYYEVANEGIIDGDGTPLRILETTSIGNAYQISNEFQGSGKIGPVDWVAGVFYLKSAPHGIVGTAAVTLATNSLPAASTGNSYRRQDSKAFYAQVGMDLSGLFNGVRLNAGIRQTRDRQTLCSTATPRGQALRSETDCMVLGRTIGGNYSATTWTLGADWQVSNEIFAYVASRRGYRAGGTNTPAFGPVLASLQDYAPEVITDVEFGLKARGKLGDMPYRASLALYRGSYTGLQRNYTLPPNFDGDGDATNDPPSGLIVNSGKAILQGVEFEGSITVLRDLALSASGTYTDAHYKSLSVNPIIASAGLIPANAIFNKFPNVPAWTYSASIEFTPDLGSIGKLLARADIYHSDKFWLNDRPAEDIAQIAPAYELVNARIGLREIAGSKLDFSLFVQNLFDKAYVAGTGGATPSLTMVTAVYGPPRIYGLEARIRF